MTILVTGGAGFIGGHMVLALLDAGEQAIVIDDMSNGVPWAIPLGVPFFQCDISDFEAVARIVREYRVNTVMHFAARLITPRFGNDPLEYALIR